MSDNMTITATADWNYEDAVQKLNKGLKKIEKRLNALSIKVKLDEKSNTELQNLIQKLNKVKKIANQIEKKGIKLNTQDNSIDKTVSELKKAKQAINEINNESIDVDTNKAENNIDNLNDSLKGVEKSADGAGNKLKKAFHDIGISLGTREALEFLKKLLSDINSAVNDFDKYSTELKIVTNQPDSVVNDMLADYAETSINLGVDIEDVEKAGIAILRAGKNAEDTNKILKDSIMLSKTGFIDSGAAAEALITTANAYDITADSIENINDKLLALDSNSQTTAGSLAAGVAKAAANAKEANVTLDSLASRIATIKQTTGKTELESATALNAMYSRLYNVKLDAYIDEDESSVEEVTAQINDMEKMLNTVNIKLRDSKESFRDFDSIIKDLSLHWDEFNDTQKSAIAKTLGGTTHRSTVLALIENQKEFERLQDISSQSMGTAAEKYSAYMESLEAKSNSLNAALKQMFANTIDSDFIGNIKSGTTEVVQFINKYEILQNLLKTATIYAVAKGFITLKSSLADTWKSLSNLSTAFQALNQVKAFNGVADKITEYDAAIKTLKISSKSLSDSQLKLVLSTKQLSESQMIEILQARGLSAEQAKTTLSTMGLVSAEGAATTATFSLSGAFKALTAAIAANPIGAIVTGLMTVLTISSAVKNKIKEAEEAEKAAAEQLKQEQEERRRAAIESSKATEQEIKSIHDLTERYVKLYSSTNDITTIKGDLSSIQDEIIDKYGKEADGIDVVNGKLSENIKRMRELEVEENKQWLRDKDQAIKDAEKFIEKPSVHGGGSTAFVGNSSTDTSNFVYKHTVAQIYQNQLEKYLKQSGMLKHFNFTNDIYDSWDNKNKVFDVSISLRDDLSEKETTEALNAFLDAYEKLYNSDVAANDPFNLAEKYNDLKSYVEEYNHSVEIVNEKSARTQKNDEWETLSRDFHEQENNFYDLLDKAAALSQEINNPENTPAVTYNKQLELDELREQIISLTSEFPTLSEEAERTFNNMGLNIDGTIASTDNLRESFFETLDEMQKGTLTNVDTIEKAMKTLAEGGELEHMEVWNIMQLDEDKITHPYYDEDAKKLKMDYEDLILLKDRLIEKEKERLQIEIETAKQEQKNAQNELAIVDARIGRINKQLQKTNEQIQQEAKGNTKPSNEVLKQQSKLHKQQSDAIDKQAELRKQIEEWGDEIQLNELLIKDLNSSLGDTIEAEKKIKKLQEDINKLQEQADNYEKAFTQKVDNVIDSLESEKEILNEELDSLNDQLDVLEKQKDELDEIIDNYKQVADIVSDAVDKEKELLEEQKKSQEDAYNERINALKEAHEQQEEENELTEKQIALQEKLQALDKAKQNKVMTYSSERGWHYDVDKEELLSAQKEVDNAQKDIDDTLAERAYEAEIKALEDERDSVLENYDLQIEAYENYVKEWKEILEEQTKAENERLAQEILGVEWREKIKDKDAQILNNYKSEFRNYNSQLSTLVNDEMENLKQSIEAKNEEIKAKQELIDQWKKYKSEVQNAINDIKNANEDYMQYLGSIALDENSNYETREANLANFAANYRYYMDEIIAKSNELEEANNRINESMANLSETRLSVDSATDTVKETGNIFGNLIDFRRLYHDILGLFPGFSNGGTADYTGLAMLHGTKSKPELILNNTDAAKLYNMIHDPSFTDMMMEKQYGNLIRSIPTNNNSTNNTSNTINIDRMEVVANDPIQFHEQFQKELKQHYRFALSESKVW